MGTETVVVWQPVRRETFIRTSCLASGANNSFAGAELVTGDPDAPSCIGVNIGSASEHLLELLLGSSWKVSKRLEAARSATLALDNRSSNPASEIR